MNPAFESYFRERLDQLGLTSSTPPQFPGGSLDENAYLIARSAVERTRSKAGLRADGELLLFLAFAELVTRPVTAVRGPTPELSEAVAEDMALITQRATRAQAGPASAHDIVNATAELWSNLRSAEWELWD
jgi:hypothetical protein